jgi:hypothetical protein
MNRKKLGDDGAVVGWDAAKANREVVRNSFKAAGHDGLVPLFDPIECLKRIVFDLVDTAKMKVRGQPIEPKQLRRDVIGVTAVREIKGDKRNHYKSLFSIGCEGSNADDFTVRFFDVDPVEAPEIAQNYATLEQAAKDLWMAHKEFIPAKDLTEALRRLVFRLKGTMVKNTGGMYFLPEEHLAEFDKVVVPIEQSDTLMTVTTILADLQMNPRLFNRLMEGLKAEILYNTQKMQDEVAALASDSKKMRRNGIERRLKDICDWTDKVEYYEQLMGVAMPTLRSAIDDAKYAIGVHGLASMGATQ